MTDEVKKEELTKDELQILIQVCNAVSLPINQAGIVLALIEKLKRLVQS